MGLIRYFSCATSLAKQIPENLKGKSKSSQDWLSRQLKDPYVEKAKMENYRCRSAFKLLEINEKHQVLKPGMCVLDCGAAPGSWSQVAVNKVNSHGKVYSERKGFVVAVDRLPMHGIEGAMVLGNCDFTLKSNQVKIISALEGRPVDLVMSDMAPNATGLKQADHDAILLLAYSVVRFCFGISEEGSSLLVKLWDGAGTRKFVEELLKFYDWVRVVKPAASRSDSAEIFILAKHFQGAVKNS